jgi:Pectate lyase superfamily protein
MASAIDPSKPEDGVPAHKEDLRSNLQAAKAEIEHGGFAEGLSPANYGPPATSTVKDHLSAIDAALGQFGAANSFIGLSDTPASYAGQATQFVKVRPDETGLEFAPAPGGSGGLTGWIDVKADFGAAANGSTNDTQAIQTALDSGASVIYLPAGTYRVTGQLTVTPGTKIVGAGAGKTIIDGSAASIGDSQAVFSCTGSTVSLPALASSITYGGDVITYAASVAASLDHGDWVRLVDNTANSFDAGCLDGFVCMVQSAEGSNLYPAQPILRTLPSPRTGGAVSNVASTKLDKRGLVVEDLTILGAGFNSTSGGSAASGAGIIALHLANVYFNRVRVLGGGSDGIRLERSANCHVTDCDVTVHTGDWTGGQQYALHVRGSSYVYLTSSNFFCPRHAVDISTRLGTSHNVIVQGCTIGAPSFVFMQPSSTANIALDWHEGNFHSKVIGCYVQGNVTLRGQRMEIINCTLENSTGQATTGMIGSALSHAADFRIEGCKIYLNKVHFQGGVLFTMLNSNWAAIDDGSIGSIVIANNDIYQMFNTSEPMIHIQNTQTFSSATGMIHITGNRVAHKEGATSQPFANITMGDGEELVVANNVLPANMTLGTIGSDFLRRVLSPNVINGHVVYTGLPTSDPGGTGRLWSDAGALKVT